MSQRTIRYSMIAIIVIVLIGILWMLFASHRQFNQALPQRVHIDTRHQPTIGNKQAKLHIVAFEDLKCVNCMRYTTTLFPKINEHYIKTGKAQYTIITLAFVPGSQAAGNAALCIFQQNPDAYFKYVEYLYAHQPPEETNWATIPTLMLFAAQIEGIHSDQLAQCLVKNPYDATLSNNLKILESIMPPPVGTPTVYINGIKVDPLTWERFQQIAKEEA